MSLEESLAHLQDSLNRLELAWLRQRHAEEKSKRKAAEAKVKLLTSQKQNLQRELSFQETCPFEHDTHSEGRSHYYIPDPVKNPKHH